MKMLLISGLMILVSFSAQAENAEKESELKLLWRPTYRPTYIYYENTDANTVDVLFDDVEGPISKQPDIEPYRIEVEWTKEASKNMTWLARFMGGLSTLQYDDKGDPADGFDGWGDAGVIIETEVSWADKLETIPLGRFYYSNFNGDVPERGYLGFAVGVKPYWGNFSLLLEASTQALGIFIPDKLGKQQDSSAFRTRAEYVIPLKDEMNIVTGAEFFHNKSDFSSSNIDGHSAVFWDDMQISLLIGIQKKL